MLYPSSFLFFSFPKSRKALLSGQGKERKGNGWTILTWNTMKNAFPKSRKALLSGYGKVVMSVELRNKCLIFSYLENCRILYSHTLHYLCPIFEFLFHSRVLN